MASTPLKTANSLKSCDNTPICDRTSKFDDELEKITPSRSMKRRAISSDEEDDSIQSIEFERNTPIADAENKENMHMSQIITRSSSARRRHIIRSNSEESDEESTDRYKTPGTTLKHADMAKRKLNVDFGEPALEQSVEKFLKNTSAGQDEDYPELIEVSSDDDSQSQDMLDKNTGSSDPENSQDEQSDVSDDLADFIVSDGSQSQEAAAGLFHQPSQGDSYKIYVQIIVSTILDNDFLPSLKEKGDAYFTEAARVVHALIETKKNAIVSPRWKAFKEMLLSYRTMESIPLPEIIKKATCEACHLPRNLSERILFYELDPNGEKITPPVKGFNVGRFCSERGSIYHELQHYDIELDEQCREKINKLIEANPEMDDKEIVESCIRDEEWLDDLYERFQKLLGLADDYSEGGVKRKYMIDYCKKFE